MFSQLIEFLDLFLERYDISAGFIALLLLAVVFVLVLCTHRIKNLKSRVDEMQPRENLMRLRESLHLERERALESKERKLDEREASLQERESAISLSPSSDEMQAKEVLYRSQAQKLDSRERKLQEKEALLREREANINLEMDKYRSALGAENKAWRDELVRRYHERVSQIEEDYSQKLREETAKIGDSYVRQHISAQSFASLRNNILHNYATLLSDPLTPELSARILSALSGDISILDEISLSANVVGSSGHVYHTTLTGCECEDFRRRRTPCKHMLLLVLSFSALGDPITSNAFNEVEELRHKCELLEKRYRRLERKDADKIAELNAEKAALVAESERRQNEIKLLLSSNKDAIPWLAGMVADYLTYDLEQKARSLDWGSDVKRQKKVESIRELRAEVQTQLQEAKAAIYQLEYLKQLYPGIEDVLDTEYTELNLLQEIPEHDPTRDYLNKDEWAKLSEVEKDQLALDRYVNSQNKTKWQIGRDYELSVSYECMQRGFAVDTFGSRMGLEDLGRDIIATSPAQTLIIQCKYWSKHKTIHEKHLFQLYGTLVMYRIDHPNMLQSVRGVFVTNTSLSDTAREVAKVLDIVVIENHSMTEFPRIKCNIGKDEHGTTRIYHLPMDMQYDAVQIKDPGEFYAFTVQEALDAGFRRAYKWHGGHVEV